MVSMLSTLLLELVRVDLEKQESHDAEIIDVLNRIKAIANSSKADGLREEVEGLLARLVDKEDFNIIKCAPCSSVFISHGQIPITGMARRPSRR